MPVVPLVRLLPALVPVAGQDARLEERPDPTTCHRCRRTFARHPSIDADRSPAPWLCPPCRCRPSWRVPTAHLRVVPAAVIADTSEGRYSDGPTR